ncbi:hypothetical protein Lal_00042088 [Lupinus albus]|nr:hypothetical protein Lal_00042088 [Lupinus albus]
MGSGALVLTTSVSSAPRIHKNNLYCFESENAPGVGKRERCNTRTSQEVTDPSTTLAQARLTAEF